MGDARDALAPRPWTRRWPASLACALGGALLVLSTALMVPSAEAASAPSPEIGDGATWASLGPAQRQALAPLQSDWGTMGPDSRRKWLGVAQRYPKLSPAEQERLHSRMGEWAKLTPEQRGQTRLGFKQAQQLTAQERQARWQAYQALPPEQRKHLADERHVRHGSVSKPPDGADAHDRHAKSNVVTNPPDRARAKSVGATLVQGGAGATTSLISKPAASPRHQHPGMPKIAATPTLVDSATLLPKRGSQAAAVTASPASSARAASR